MASILPGKYILQSNTGRQDKILINRKLLAERISNIRRAKCKQRKLPALGDILPSHETFIYAHYRPIIPIAYEYELIDPFSTTGFGGELNFQLTQIADLWMDMAIYIRVRGANCISAVDKCFHSPLLAHRMIKKVTLRTSSSIIDEYTGDALTKFYNYNLKAGKRPKWRECVGQETPREAYFKQELSDEYREVKMIADGLQTPKNDHGEFELWIPLIFWFNTSPENALPYVLLEHGQTFITVELNDGNTFSQGVDLGGGGLINQPQLLEAKLLINHLHVTESVRKILRTNTKRRICRLHRIIEKPIVGNSGRIRIDSVKYPIESMYFGIKLDGQDTPADGTKFYRVTNNTITYPARKPNALPPPTNQLIYSDAQYETRDPILTNIRIESQGNDVYREFKGSFYSKYLNLYHERLSPEDPGLHIVPFSFFTNITQPTGYYNPGSNKEFFIVYEADMQGQTGKLVLIANTINFVQYSQGGDLSIRYKL
jgi:hypothetical protein